MPRYIVFTTLNGAGLTALKKRTGEAPDIGAEVEALGGKLVEQHALFGDFHFLSVVDLPSNDAAQRLNLPEVHGETLSREIVPVIDGDLFARLLTQTTESAGPHKWQTWLPVRALRPLFWWEAYFRDLRRYCTPFTVTGRENFDSVRGPIIVIANHASHLDGNALFAALPLRYKFRIFYGGAADRWFLKGRKEIRMQAWYRSLAYNAFPIKRGGGSASLDYPKWLIDKGNSIAIFPEGTRTTTGRLSKFRIGPSLMAIEKQIPVVPLYMEGLREIRPKGSKKLVPGPVTVHVGVPMRFGPGTDPKVATKAMYDAMEGMRQAVHKPYSERAKAQSPDKELVTSA
ncbi:MAG: 1-acyl-sn-glycerol-3-phosphate acyltransferase [Acidimicrobiales bacterium]